jgi:hypothetical protein
MIVLLVQLAYSDMDSTGRFVSDLPGMSGSPKWEPSCVLDFLVSDRMCPGATEPQSSGRFFGGCFGRSFYNGSERIAELLGEFPVCVIYTPKLIALLRC